MANDGGKKPKGKVADHLYHTRIDLPWARLLTNYPEFALARIMQLWQGMEVKVYRNALHNEEDYVEPDPDAPQAQDT